MEVKFEKEHLKAIKTHACCPICENQLEYTGRIHYSDPVTYPHFCQKCNRQFYLDKKYPTLEIL